MNIPEPKTSRETYWNSIPSMKLPASFPLNRLAFPKGKDHFPTIIFQGRAVNIRECTFCWLIHPWNDFRFPLSNSWMLYQLRSDKVVEISAKSQVPLSSKDPRVDFSAFSRSIFAHMVSPSQNHKIARPERLLRLWYTNMGILLNMRMSCCQVRLPENEALHWKVHLDDMIQKKSRSICLITWCINPSIVPIFKHLNRADLGVAGRDSHSAIQMV